MDLDLDMALPKAFLLLETPDSAVQEPTNPSLHLHEGSWLKVQLKAIFFIEFSRYKKHINISITLPHPSSIKTKKQNKKNA